ncbi:MAG: 3-hydroxyacyl-CoA dehydrogenase [Chloroflexi bacterium]|nr:MAG: 3-hydroxyacyl-CoA dehydrogenase [Chloroflexota bacterium]RLC96896.1 MAG: 3-hydroxyacyl-CoA dehydrogenase [Chloroflexota bacterium]
MADRLKGRNAVVTGGGRGIGKAVALALAEEGANVVVCDIGGAVDGSGVDKTPADEVVEECKKLGVKAIAQCGDVSKFADAEAAVKACVDNFGRIDIVCNIAGIDRPKMIWNMSEEEWDQVVAVHLKGTFNFIRNAAPLMREQRYGRIINTVSEAFTGGPSHLNYAAAKGGIATLTYGAARELGRYGVTCNAICPRAWTRMTADDKVIEGIKKRIAAGLMPADQLDRMMNELADPSYFAAFVAYLASDEAANVNGQIFFVSGTELGHWTQPVVENKVTRDWKKEGPWRFDELVKLVPEKLLVGYVNPAPPQPEEKK